ncbi:ABC transporter permease [Diaminobutyricibacter tongyongensis]|uniref:ABC transporter permease n=1 Tax=Leifsonia tongyongensis TaxID=1268043 RepID=A0A6L9XVC2_9MICO|nr:ABC transporter permease [Diaminobutyricibacter tongyongensis]
MTIPILKKLARAVAVLLVVTFVTFCLMFGNAEGIARGVLGLSATESDVQREIVKLGLDQPLFVQYGKWLLGVVTGDLGHSYFTGQSVNDALATRVPVTLSLVLGTLILTLLLSVVIGVAAAIFGGWIDRVVQFLTVLGAAVPAFIIGVVLVFSFAIAIPLFPATGYISLADDPAGWLHSITLPVAALLIGSVASAATQIRGAVLDVQGKDFVRTLRARGISEGPLLFRHVLRNASGPGLTVLSLQTIALLGGAVFVEQIFALPGIGQLANTSAQQGDVPIVMGIVLVTIVFVLIVNLLGDLANIALNPKARTR